jgi:hypothetical protein
METLLSNRILEPKNGRYLKRNNHQSWERLGNSFVLATAEQLEFLPNG